MKKHLIVFLAYKHPVIIHNSFDSIYKKSDADFFVIENPSENSGVIEDYFKEFTKFKDFIGYIRFHENIANSSINIFLENFKDLISKYEYITITDGDLFVYNIEDAFTEIFEGLEMPNVVVATCDLWSGNNYLNETILDVKDYIMYNHSLKKSNQKRWCEQGHTGNFLLTLKTKNISIFDNIIYVDSFIAEKINKLGLSWVHTTKNLAYHETWDLYREGNPYYEFKKQVFDKIWFKKQHSEYDILKLKLI